MSKQWGHGFHNGFAGRTAESQRMIEEYGLKPRNGETAQELLARETGYAEGWGDAMMVSPWLHFWARRALMKRSNVKVRGWPQRTAARVEEQATHDTQPKPLTASPA